MKSVMRLMAFVVALTAGFSVCATEAVEYRLPPGITPLAQEINLKLDPGQADYSGSTTILLKIDNEVDRIGIYQVGLDITDITLGFESDSRTLTATEGDYAMTWLSDGSPIEAGEYRLSMTYTGEYSTDALGMHRVTYEENDYIATQFESMYARRAFPVFDEPGFKIPYRLTIEAPVGQTVVANTPIESTSEADGWQTVTFMETPPLSSYLIAYAVGPYDRAPIEGMSMPSFVYTPKGHAGDVGFVQRETPKIVEYLESYFGFDYPFRKLDFIAVPEFAFGAMENPGLITYRTDLLMVGDEPTGTTAQTVLGVIAHEVAHIWYGDLVTMAWWNELWLNEAFASWMAGTAMQKVYPEYETQLTLPQSGAFAQDQRTSTKPIRREVREVDDAFDDVLLNYTKGYAILNMLENYVGHDAWQRGVQAYINKHAWGNATETDLWDAISEEAGLDVGAIASAYLNQPSFAKLTFDANGNVTQERYLAYGTEAPELEWKIPLTLKYKKDGDVRQSFYLLDEKSGSADVPEGADWIYPDTGANGYFRWQIDLEQFYKLVEDSADLTNREKIALLDNSEALLNAGDLSLGDYLFVVNKNISDPHPLVFLPALEKVKEIGDDFTDAESRELFSRFVDEKLAPRLVEFGVEAQDSDSEAIVKMRPRLLRVLGEYGSDPAAREMARDVAKRYLADSDSVNADLGREALRVTALNDDGDRYGQYMDTYLHSGSEDQKSNILAASYFRSPKIVSRHLDFSISENVPAGDAIGGIYYYADIVEDHTLMYKWLEENIEAFEAKIPAYYHTILPEYLVGVCTDENLKLMEEFFGADPDKYSESLARATETVSNCIGRKERAKDGLMEFLAQYDD